MLVIHTVNFVVGGSAVASVFSCVVVVSIRVMQSVVHAGSVCACMLFECWMTIVRESGREV